MRAMTGSAAVLSVLLSVGCGGNVRLGGNDTGDGGRSTLRPFTIQITPATATLTTANDTPVTQAYTAMATFADGTTMDVTNVAYWSLEAPQLATFTGASLMTTGLPGITNVHASWNGGDAQSKLTVSVERDRLVTGAPTNAPQLFTAATESSALAPTILYPADDSAMPPNIGDFEMHWQQNGGANLYQVTLTSALVQINLYSQGSPGTSSGTFWTALSSATTNDWTTLANDARGSTFKATVRGLNTASPSTAGTSTAITIRLSNNDLMGGIYYWSSTIPGIGIYRHDFSKPNTPPESYYDNSTVSDNAKSAITCVGCHSVSQDGTKMAMAYQYVPHWGVVIDIATRTPTYTPASNLNFIFPTFEPPMSAHMVTVSEDNTGTLSLRDPSDGSVLSTVTTPGFSTTPEFSPDGTKLAYVVARGAHEDEAHITQGEIVVQDFDSLTETFGASHVLVSQSGNQNNYYPSWSPDGKWILFNQSTAGSYNETTAQLYAVPVDGSSAPVALSAANRAANLTNSWPKFAPFIETSTNGESNNLSLFWLTFSSTRAFGARATGGEQLWMTPFYWGNASAGHDPSSPAFHLPFQNMATSNHSAQWTQTVVAAPPIIN